MTWSRTNPFATGDRLDVTPLNQGVVNTVAIVTGTQAFDRLALGRARTTATGTQRDFDLDALASAPAIGISWLQFNGGGTMTLGGLAGNLEGRFLLGQNISASTVTITQNDTGNSVDAHRILTATGADLSLLAGHSALFFWDGTISRWYATLLP